MRGEISYRHPLQLSCNVADEPSYRTHLCAFTRCFLPLSPFPPFPLSFLLSLSLSLSRSLSQVSVNLNTNALNFVFHASSHKDCPFFTDSSCIACNNSLTGAVWRIFLSPYLSIYLIRSLRCIDMTFPFVRFDQRWTFNDSFAFLARWFIFSLS